MNHAPETALLQGLRAARDAERQQSQYYRRLASLAEDAGDDDASERLNGLHADEQHHLSRITARLLELGDASAAADDAPAESPYPAWEEDARVREQGEIIRYEKLLALQPDAETTAMLQEILLAERAHERELGGKWMQA